jgi:methyltransferase
MTVTRTQMHSLISRYFDGCNEADEAKMTACFVPQAVHYFPDGMPTGPFIGSSVIAARWAEAVANLGSYWTVDNFCGDETAGVAVIEWTHFKQYQDVVLRGDEWYRFDPETGLIAEIRAYYAAPQPEGKPIVQLGRFDYAGRGYPLSPPLVRTRPGA